MDWKDKIAGCFGHDLAGFASHALDEERAFELLTILRAKEIGWQEAADEVENYLISKTGNAQFSAEQMKKVETYFKPWLLD